MASEPTSENVRIKKFAGEWYTPPSHVILALGVSNIPTLS